MSVQAITCAMALRGISPTEKLLLLALANYADERMRCWPSQRRLAEDTCLTDRTVRSLLAELERRGMLSRLRRDRDDASRTTDVITLHFAGEVVTSASGGAEMISGGVRKELPGGAETVSGHEPSTNHQSEQTDEPEGFADWWEGYPKKVSKGSARKAYKVALKKITAERLLAALERHQFAREQQFVPNPATWLNGERWLDGLSERPEPTPAARNADPWPSRLRDFQRNGYWNSTDWGP